MEIAALQKWMDHFNALWVGIVEQLYFCMQAASYLYYKWLEHYIQVVCLACQVVKELPWESTLL